MGSLLFGARNAVKLVGLKKGEHVLIIAQKSNISVGRALEKVCMQKTSIIDFFVMESLGSRPLKKVPLRVLQSAKGAKVIFFLADSFRRGKINERFTFRVPITKIAVKNRARLAAMIGIDGQCMRQGLCADYKKIARVSKKLFRLLSNCRSIRVVSPDGTFLSAQFSPKFKWVVSDGKIGPGKWSNLPDGEVFTSPLCVDGVAVINGSLGDVFSKEFGSLEKTPVYWFIEGSRVKRVFCPKNKKLERKFRAMLCFDKNSDRIGEFSLGTNFGVKKIIGNLLQDEKIVGVHMAVGFPYPELTGANWFSGIHCDGVMKGVTVFVDKKLVMAGGKFVF